MMCICALIAICRRTPGDHPLEANDFSISFLFSARITLEIIRLSFHQMRKHSESFLVKLHWKMGKCITFREVYENKTKASIFGRLRNKNRLKSTSIPFSGKNLFTNAPPTAFGECFSILFFSFFSSSVLRCSHSATNIFLSGFCCCCCSCDWGTYSSKWMEMWNMGIFNTFRMQFE